LKQNKFKKILNLAEVFSPDEIMSLRDELYELKISKQHDAMLVEQRCLMEEHSHGDQWMWKSPSTKITYEWVCLDLEDNVKVWRPMRAYAVLKWKRRKVDRFLGKYIYLRHTLNWSHPDIIIK